MGVCPKNRAELVDGILAKLTGVTNPDEDLQLQILNEKHSSNGKKRFPFDLCFHFVAFLMTRHHSNLGEP